MTDTVLDIDLDSLVDMNIAPQCEHYEHMTRLDMHFGDAKYLIHRRAHCHVSDATYLLCQPAWTHAGYVGLHCKECKRLFNRDDIWSILEVL